MPPIPNPAHPFIRDAHFRKWDWADEEGFTKIYHIVAGKPVDYKIGVLTVGPSGAWDDNRVTPGFGSILYFPAGLDGYKYWLYYGGHDGTNWRIGLARSNDGETFTKYVGNPILDLGAPGTWDELHVVNPSVIYNPAWTNPFRMYYTGINAGMAITAGIAESVDGKTFTKYGQIWTIGYNFSVLQLGGLFYSLYLHTATGTLAAAYSHDGYDFTNFGTVLERGAAGEWDDYRIGDASIYWSLGIFYITYGGHDGTVWRSGLAINWNPFSTYSKAPYNPVTIADKLCLNLLRMEDKFFLYYRDQTIANWRINLATIP